VGDPPPQLAYHILSIDSINTCHPGPPEERLFIFSDLDAVTAHMHVQHKLGPKSKRFQTISSQSATQIPKTDQGKHVESISFWKNASVTSGKGIMSCSAAQNIKPKACSSVQAYRRPTNLP